MTQFVRMILISGLSGLFAAGCVWLAWDLAGRVATEWSARPKPPVSKPPEKASAPAENKT